MSAIVAEALATGGDASGILAGCTEAVLPTVSGALAIIGRATGSGVAVERAVRRARDRGAGCCPARNERPISGPAVNSTNAPATAPTGPRTIAPDSAPRAALPARSCACACASNDIKAPASAAATISFFMAVSLNAPRGTGLRKCGSTRVIRRQTPGAGELSKHSEIERSAPKALASFGAGARNVRHSWRARGERGPRGAFKSCSRATGRQHCHGIRKVKPRYAWQADAS